MIITLTLNLAIDQTLVLDRFVAGDALRVKSSRFDPGGKGINVSRVTRELGGESVEMGVAAGTACVLTPGTKLRHHLEVDLLQPRVRVKRIEPEPAVAQGE